MSHQRVPSWDIDDETSPFAPPAQPFLFHHNNPLVPASAAASPEYEVAELTWKDGNLATLGLRHPPRIGKPTPRYPSPAACAAGGTLECIVDQARGASSGPDPLCWAAGAHRPPAVDALVPCADHGSEGKRPKVNGRNCASQGSTATVSLTAVGNGESTLVTLGTCELTASVGTDDIGFSATTARDTEEGGGSPETGNGSFAGTRLFDVDDHNSVSHSLRSKPDALREMRTASISTKRSRVAAVHNQSERKRRDRINQKMKTLQKLLPNSNKTDKASMLDEVIEYLKLLQAQVHMMSRMGVVPPLMLPIAMQQQQQQQQQLHFSMMARLCRMSMGLGMMDPSFLGGHGCAGLAPPMIHPSTFFPLQAAAAGGAWDAGMHQHGGRVFPDMLSTFIGCPAQQQNLSTEAYSRMAALYQQLYGYNQKI